jgi:hypothetical protein
VADRVQVKLLTGLSGSQGSWQPGEAYPCTAAEAARLIERGYAEPLGRAVETATKPAPRARRKA